MKGYEILSEVRKLTPEQLDYFLQHLLGKMSMDFEGYQDSPSRPEHLYSKYVFDNMDDSITRARLGDVARPLPVCDKHGPHMSDACQLCIHEADHPPVTPKGSDELSPEQLQALHRKQLVTTADSIENVYDQAPVPRPIYGEANCPKCSQRQPFTMYRDHVIKCQVCCTEQRLNPELGWRQTWAQGVEDITAKVTEFCKPKAEMIDGLLVSTDSLAYHLIPVIAIQRLCERIMLGEETKGKDAWNALSNNQSVLDSKRALARRFGHTINHAYRLLGKIQRGESWTEEDEKEASAVMWGGMYAICAIHQQRTTPK